MISREDIIQALKDTLTACQEVECAFLSGSAAFARMDEYSDLDVRVVANRAEAEVILSKVENALLRLCPIKRHYRPARHDDAVQIFYSLEAASRFHVIDFAIMSEAMLAPLRDPARHGTPVVWCDRKGLIKPVSDEATKRKLKAREAELKDAFWFHGRVLVERAILRGRFSEAVHHYHTRVLGPLVELLRSQHSPLRQDYGVRYLAWDVPKDVEARIDALYKIASFDDLVHALDEAEGWFRAIEAGQAKIACPHN